MAKIKGTEESIPHLLLPLIVTHTGLILDPCTSHVNKNKRLLLKSTPLYYRLSYHRGRKSDAGCLPFVKKFRKFWLGIFGR